VERNANYDYQTPLPVPTAYLRVETLELPGIKPFLKLSARLDDNLCAGGTRSRSNTLDGLDDVHTLDDLAEDDVLAIEPGCLGGTEEDCDKIG
jgi:hypothetical protein